MKRPVRPFVVEVKKKRGTISKPRSIWGDIVFSAVADEPMREPAQLSQSNTLASDRMSSETPDPISTGSPEAVVERAEIVDDVGGSEGGHNGAKADIENEVKKPLRPDRRRIRRADEPKLPRGQRWKRRLPKVLREVT
ncbi:hypothetical protein AB4Z43_28945 [Mesorhizobium sp. 2RAF45]|uniref:hypothetical protein n=1 Tax=Mesorhizobium sp. 2RAF45 TaxID=3233001 RepID=UPI003F9E6787